MPTISIALCTYNGGRFLETQLNSLAGQTRQPFEVVICDDGSDDDTDEIIRNFSCIAPFQVHYTKNDERLGYIENFMKATGFCQGDLISFCDQDDIWYPRKLEKLEQYFLNEDVVLAYHAVDLVDSEGVFIRKYDDRSPGRTLLPPLTGSPWIYGMGFSIMIRNVLKIGVEFSNLTFDQNIPDKPISHDQWYTFLASVLGYIAYDETSLAGYRQHSTNVVGALKKLRPSPKNLRDKAALDAEEYGRCAGACAGRAKILRLMCQSLSSNLRERALAGAGKYEEMYKMFLLRNTMYQSHSVLEKFSLIKSLYDLSGYGDNKPWAFGRKAMLKDLGLLFIRA